MLSISDTHSNAYWAKFAVNNVFSWPPPSVTHLWKLISEHHQLLLYLDSSSQMSQQDMGPRDCVFHLSCYTSLPLSSKSYLPSKPSTKPSSSEKLSPATHSRIGSRTRSRGTDTACPALALSVLLATCCYSFSSRWSCPGGKDCLSLPLVNTSLCIYGGNDAGVLQKWAATMKKSYMENILWVWALPCRP